MPKYTEPAKFKQGYQTFRRFENKVGVFVFLLTMLALLVAGLLYLVPEAPDSLWFVTMLVLFVTGLASAIGAWAKRVNRRNQANSKDYHDRRDHR